MRSQNQNENTESHSRSGTNREINNFHCASSHTRIIVKEIRRNETVKKTNKINGEKNAHKQFHRICRQPCNISNRNCGRKATCTNSARRNGPNVDLNECKHLWHTTPKSHLMPFARLRGSA